MAIDLNNPAAMEGAMAALKILIKSKDGPIEVVGGTPGPTGGGGLIPPKNIKVTPPKGQQPPEQPGQPGQDQPQPPQGQGGSGTAKGAKKLDDKPNQPGQGGGAGEKGDKPENGQGGNKGDQGNEKGEKGDTGAQGEKGEQGEKGNEGGNGSGQEGQQSGKSGSQGSQDNGGQENPHGTDQGGEGTGAQKGGLRDTEANEKTLAGVKADQQEKQQAEIDLQNQAAKDAYEKMVAQARVGSYEEFVADLYYLVKSQVKESNKDYEDGYTRGPNASYAGTNALMPKDIATEKKEIPTIYIFFDVSGSFNDTKIQQGIDALGALDEFANSNPPKIHIMPPFGFNNKCEPLDKISHGGGTHGFPYVLNIIKNSLDLPNGERCTNVIIITDDDIEIQTGWGRSFNSSTKSGHNGWNETVHIPGHVFWCWIDGQKSPTATRYLVGDEGNSQYRM